jgi:hypothetical protein
MIGKGWRGTNNGHTGQPDSVIAIDGKTARGSAADEGQAQTEEQSTRTVQGKTTVEQ